MASEPTSQLPLFSGSDPEAPALISNDGGRPMLGGSASLKAGIVAWQDHMAREGRSPHTVKAFGADLVLLSRYVGPAVSLDDVGTRELENFLLWMETGRGVPCSPKTYARRVTSLKSFFRWLTHTGALEADPADPVVQKSAVSPLPDILHPDEVRSVLAAGNLFRNGLQPGRTNGPAKPDARPYVLVALLLKTGIKKGECLALVPNHVDLAHPGGPVLWVRYADPKHRYKERKLALEADWVPAFEEYRRQHSLKERLFPWSPRRLEYILEDIGRMAGLNKHLSFDMCRWTCAVRDRQAGMESDKIRLKLGLSKIQWREVGNKLERLVEAPL